MMVKILNEEPKDIISFMLQFLKAKRQARALADPWLHVIIMNTDEKLTVLLKFVNDLDAFTRAQEAYPAVLTPEQIDSTSLPQIDLVGELMAHHDSIMKGIEDTYSVVRPVLEELNGLQS